MPEWSLARMGASSVCRRSASRGEMEFGLASWCSVAATRTRPPDGGSSSRRRKVNDLHARHLFSRPFAVRFRSRSRAWPQVVSRWRSCASIEPGHCRARVSPSRLRHSRCLSRTNLQQPRFWLCRRPCPRSHSPAGCATGGPSRRRSPLHLRRCSRPGGSHSRRAWLAILSRPRAGLSRSVELES